MPDHQIPNDKTHSAACPVSASRRERSFATALHCDPWPRCSERPGGSYPDPVTRCGAALAARAYIQHHLTGYHDALDHLATDDWDDEYLYHQVKSQAQHDVDDFVAEHRLPTP